MKRKRKPQAGADPKVTSDPSQAKVQGEGDYEAARRYRAEVEHFVHTADIEGAARDAAPRNEREASEMAAAEAAGRSHAKNPGPAAKPSARKP